MSITMNVYYTLALAVGVLLLGQVIKDHSAVLRKFCIPVPVVGGVLFALVITVGTLTKAFSISLDSSFNEFFSLLFYAGIGYTASWKLLKKGGPAVIVFLLVSAVLVVLQNLLGVGLCKLLDIDPLIGLATGSIPMVGGNGTAAAWGPTLEAAGLEEATTIATAAATFGLVSGALIGGPIGRYLIERNDLKSDPNAKEMVLGDLEKKPDGNVKKCEPINEKRLTVATYQVLVTVGIGALISFLLKKTGIDFPASVGAMTAAAILRNIADSNEKIDLKLPELSVISNVSLLIFLALSMMTMKLWKIVDLALPMIIILVAQMILMTLFAIFVTFPIMGKDFDAAIITSGQCGFGLGAVPTAMANMQTLEAKYGRSPSAFFIVPLVGSLFINLVNSVFITLFLNLI